MAAILSRPQCVKRYHYTHHKFTTRKLQLHENVVKELAKSCPLFIYIGIPYSSNCYSDTRFLLLQRFGPMHIFKFFVLYCSLTTMEKQSLVNLRSRLRKCIMHIRPNFALWFWFQSRKFLQVLIKCNMIFTSCRVITHLKRNAMPNWWRRIRTH